METYGTCLGRQSGYITSSTAKVPHKNEKERMVFIPKKDMYYIQLQGFLCLPLNIFLWISIYPTQKKTISMSTIMFEGNVQYTDTHFNIWVSKVAAQ